MLKHSANPRMSSIKYTVHGIAELNILSPELLKYTVPGTPLLGLCDGAQVGAIDETMEREQRASRFDIAEDGFAY